MATKSSTNSASRSQSKSSATKSDCNCGCGGKKRVKENAMESGSEMNTTSRASRSCSSVRNN